LVWPAADEFGKMADELGSNIVHGKGIYRDAGTGGQEGQPPPLPFTRRGKAAKVPFQFKGLPWRNSKLSEMLVQFFYEFASENARHAVIELQE
jgi:hypothetical protein